MPQGAVKIPSLFITLFLFLLCAMTPVGAQQPETGTPTAAGSPTANVGPKFLILPVDGQDGDYFTLEAEPGTSHELKVLLANADDQPLGLRTFASDVLPAVNGGFAVASADTPPTGTATWLDYAPETFDFEPGQGVERTFKVNIPDDAEPGQYIAGLTLETAEPLDVEGTELFKQVIQKSIAVFIIVPGPEKPAFALLDPEFVADPSSPRIEIHVENSGNVLVKPAGELTLTNESGEKIFSAPIQMGSVYAGMTVLLSVPVASSVSDGDYIMSVELSDEETSTSASIPSESIFVTREVQAPAQFELAGSVTLMPDGAKPSFADVTVTVNNIGSAAQQSELILAARRDGELVETFTLAPSLALPPGETTIAQRYIPPTGWETGTWTFVISLNLIDPTTGSATTVATLDSIPEVEIPA